MRLLIAVSLMCAGAILVLEAQSADSALRDRVKRLFPNAISISPKESIPPHFKIFERGANGEPQLAGVAFLTTELDPLERGYDGPIKILVGLKPDGILAGISVIEHREPYGSFSVETEAFAAQFAGKDIRAPFKVGEDVDAISRASITVQSATRAIRNSSRRIARQVLTPPTR